MRKEDPLPLRRAKLRQMFEYLGDGFGSSIRSGILRRENLGAGRWGSSCRNPSRDFGKGLLGEKMQVALDFISPVIALGLFTLWIIYRG